MGVGHKGLELLVQIQQDAVTVQADGD